jgi:phosphohistidine phosphatase
MRLYLMRHGKPRPREEDPERGLTEEGKREARAVARALAAVRPGLAAIWHSGKKRALQTAQLVGQALGSSAPLKAHSGLEPLDPVSPLLEELESCAGDLLIVGHLPQLSRLAARLLAGREEPPLLEFPAAGLACLEKQEQGWLLCFFLTPELL